MSSVVGCTASTNLQMRKALLCWLFAAASAEAADQDGLLALLVDDALATRPELAQARAEVRGAMERVPQAGAWPDPMIQFGVQNDSFNKWQVGTMETSWLSLMASQTIPFPGKPGLRAEIADVDVAVRKLVVERIRLSTTAEVKRAYLSLQLARARLELLGKLEALLRQAVEVAHARYESGDGAQSDILRAQLELGRLAQQRMLLEADERIQIEALNRLRGRALGERVDAAPLALRPFPSVPAVEDAVTRTFASSPEYQAAKAAVGGAQRTRELGRRQYLPDVAVGAGVMLRGGLDPMWTVTLGVPLPVFAGVKQARAVAEADAAVESKTRGVEVLEQLLRLRTAQRIASWGALRGVWDSYQGRLLAEADATAAATLTQYRVGKVPFAAVLEATTATISLTDASNVVLVDAWRLSVAQDEVSLAEVSGNSAALSVGVPGASAGGMSGVRGASSSGMSGDAPAGATSSREM